MHRPGSIGLAAICALLAANAAPAFAGGYAFTNLVLPGMPAGNTAQAYAINNSNQIVLESYDASGAATYGLLYNTLSHTYSPLPSYPGAVPGSIVVNGINDSGQLAGSYYPPSTSGTYQAFLYSGGSFTNVTPAAYLTHATVGAGINNAGQIVADVALTGPFPNQGLLLSGGTSSMITVPGNITLAYGINNHGDIVGAYGPGAVSYIGAVYGFVDNGGVFTTIALPGVLQTSASGINDSGEIVGSSSNGTNTNGFVDIGGIFTTFDVPGAVTTIPYGVNNLGQIVGSYTDASGATYAFLATPSAVPEPSALLMMGTASLAFGMWRRRQKPA